jgi:hypothetical protein
MVRLPGSLQTRRMLGSDYQPGKLGDHVCLPVVYHVLPEYYAITAAATEAIFPRNGGFLIWSDDGDRVAPCRVVGADDPIAARRVEGVREESTVTDRDFSGADGVAGKLWPLLG